MMSCAVLLLCLSRLFVENIASELSEEIWLMPEESVDLSCRAERLGAIFEDLTTRWERDGQPVASSAHAQLLTDAGLRLTDVRLTDSGVYVCKGRAAGAAVDVNTITLHVGTAMQEELMKRNGLNIGLGIPVLWVEGFLMSIATCVVFVLMMIVMRVVYKIKARQLKV